MGRRVFYILAAALTVALAACNRGPGDVPGAVPAAVYYWRTTMSLDSAERAFLTRHHVEKMYVRFFDVVLQRGHAVPNATITGLDSVPPGVEVVPTVFIMENSLRADSALLPGLLVKRVKQMCETHGIAARELQVDCDWTLRSMPLYYKMLESMRSQTEALGWRLSATVRLHQLSMPAPPVDYGVLMMYNTGDVRRRDGTDPILDARHVAPYLRRLADYPLPLCAAYPCFTWQLLYAHGDGHFKAILRDDDLGDTTRFRSISTLNPQPLNLSYLVTRNSELPESNSDGSASTRMMVGDTVVVARPTEHDILATRDALEAHRPGINRQVVLYSLNSNQMKHYNDSLYEKIFNP